MRKTFLVTGATGALGSTLIPHLVSQGHHVLCLARANAEGTAVERVHRAIESPENLTVLEGDIHDTHCGIPELAIACWNGRVDAIVHCAASIGFDNQAAAHTTNVEGLTHTLRLAEALDIPHFHHVSTAYIAGNAMRLAEHEWNVGQSWRNHYEQSKYTGEGVVRTWAHLTKRALAIYRPSILVGREDGTTPTFDGYYGFFRPIYGVADYVWKNDPTPNDQVTIPLVIHASWIATLNLVRIDWAAHTLAELVMAAATGTHHLVNPNPPLVRWVIETSLQALRIEGVRIVQTAQEKQDLVAQQDPTTGRLQALVDRVLNLYVPYVTGEAVFETSLIGHPPITSDFLARQLQYAVATQWRRKRNAP